jgi:1-acyl-sn-glycerol-3-phosphate acyltransferase
MARLPSVPAPKVPRPKVPGFAKDLRPAEAFARYHRRTRRGVPWLQTLALLLLLPPVALVARIRFRGREHVPGGGYIVASNHPSVLDALFVAAAVRRRIRFMGKSDLFTVRWGRLLSRLGAFPVRRGVWDTDAFETAANVLTRGRVLAVFPEGGVSPPGGYRSAKSGIGHIALMAGATILPVHLDGPRRLYRPWTWPHVTVTVGEPFAVAPGDPGDRAACQAIADRTLAAIVAAASA